MNDSTYATAIAALDAYYSATLWASQNWQNSDADRAEYAVKMADIKVARDELAAQHAPAAGLRRGG